MVLYRTPEGTEKILHEEEPEEDPTTLVEVGTVPDESSGLWMGTSHGLNRSAVEQLVAHLQAWLATGSLELPASAE